MKQLQYERKRISDWVNIKSTNLLEVHVVVRLEVVHLEDCLLVELALVLSVVEV